MTLKQTPDNPGGRLYDIARGKPWGNKSYLTYRLDQHNATPIRICLLLPKQGESDVIWVVIEASNHHDSDNFRVGYIHQMESYTIWPDGCCFSQVAVFVDSLTAAGGPSLNIGEILGPDALELRAERIYCPPERLQGTILRERLNIIADWLEADLPEEHRPPSGVAIRILGNYVPSLVREAEEREIAERGAVAVAPPQP